MNINILDLIDVSLLQRLQDSFSRMTGMAALTTDANGKPVTVGSGFTDYCMKYTRMSEVGCSRCEECDRFGAETTMKTKRFTTYQCHSGLIDFSAPIIVENQMVGCFIGGQVLTELPSEEIIREIAKDLDINPDEYWEALKKVPVMPRESIDQAAQFLYEIADVLSDIAYGKYMVMQADEEIMKAANSKTDFLANMSHEIRTPMNAVIGLAEVALREEMSPTARDCITQIKSSGTALLNIINDILDFSKIESGKMDITPVEYVPYSLFNDVINIIKTRMIDKNVELILDMNPDLPSGLIGDNLRVRQILINLANNAVKFTNKGKVTISADYDMIDDQHILLKIKVTDTGIGIKKHDLDKIFNSFQQVDSKRNRTVEGTGLGLAISRQLITLMGGDIHVESVYEEGSTFSFEIPQEVTDWAPSAKVNDIDHIAIIGYFSNSIIAKEFYKDLNRLHVMNYAYSDSYEIEEFLEDYSDELEGKNVYWFFDENNYSDDIIQMLEKHEDFNSVEVVDMYSTQKPQQKNQIVVNKPLSVNQIASVLNQEDLHSHEKSSDFSFDFVAPNAKILLVDDNEINLTVAEGLLEPLNMNITKALNGKEAIELIGKQKFDLIFMDHMMPDMDGVETTRIIRRLHPSYADVPIIALTANAMSGVKEMFISEGMNDFIAKPIELRTIVRMIKEWLPSELIQKSKDVTEVSKTSDSVITIGDLDTEAALELIGNERLYWSILKEYYRTIPIKSERIQEFLEHNDIKAYTIEVHALKSSSKQIGAFKLSEQAARLEQAGNEGDIEMILQDTPTMILKFMDYSKVLKPFFEEKAEENQESKNAISKTELDAYLNDMLDAVDNLDIDTMESVVQEMKQFKYEGNDEAMFMQLCEAVENIDVDACTDIIEQWR